MPVASLAGEGPGRADEAAEEAAAVPTMGFCERLLETADATDTASVGSRSWIGEARTLLRVRWTK